MCLRPESWVRCGYRERTHASPRGAPDAHRGHASAMFGGRPAAVTGGAWQSPRAPDACLATPAAPSFKRHRRRSPGVDTARPSPPQQTARRMPEPTQCPAVSIDVRLTDVRHIAASLASPLQENANGSAARANAVGSPIAQARARVAGSPFVRGSRRRPLRGHAQNLGTEWHDVDDAGRSGERWKSAESR